MRKTVHALTIALIGLIALMALSPTVAAASTSATVSITGKEGVSPNHKVFSSFRFSPGKIEISSGGTISFLNNVTNDGHTISLVNIEDLPTTIDQVFACGSPGTVCAAVFAAHFPNGPSAPPIPFVNVQPNPGGFAASGPLCGQEPSPCQGNSLIVPPGTDQLFTLTVTARSGTTLHYMCAIHPWMQGSIVVK